MAVRFYLIPIEETTAPDGSSARGPKYFTWHRDPDPPALMAGVASEIRDFGLEPTALCAADVTPAQNATLAALPDVTVIPANLDNNIGAANLATVQAALENLHIPADAIAAATTYRQVVRGVLAIFAVAQRFNALSGRLFPAGITLSTQLSDLSANVRGQLQEAATELGYSYAGLTLTSTLRDVLKALANQQAPQTMLGVTI